MQPLKANRSLTRWLLCTSRLLIESLHCLEQPRGGYSQSNQYEGDMRGESFPYLYLKGIDLHNSSASMHQMQKYLPRTRQYLPLFALSVCAQSHSHVIVPRARQYLPTLCPLHYAGRMWIPSFGSPVLPWEYFEAICLALEIYNVTSEEKASFARALQGH